MSLVINTNLSALNTVNQLNKNSTLMNSSLQKLSSGYAINSAADNAAGLAISEKMENQIRGLDQASSNSQDAISLSQTAEGALDETNSILERMRELAVQSSSDSLTDDDRTACQDEVNQLSQEIDRISNETEFNTKKLLDGSCATTTAVSGTNASLINSAATVAASTTSAGTYTVKYNSIATQATTGTATQATSNATGLTATTSDASSFAGTIEINGTSITISSGDTIQGVLQNINDLTDTTGVTATFVTNSGNGYIKLTDDSYGNDSSITLSGNASTLSGLFAAQATSATATSVTTTGTDATGLINGAVATADGNTLTAFGLTVTGDDTALATYASSSAYTTLQTNATSTAATVTTDLSTLVTALGASTDTTTGTADNAAATAYTTAVTGGDADTIATAKAALLAQAAVSGDSATGTALSAYNTAVTAANTAATALANAAPTATVTVDDTNSLTFQIGANEGQTMTLSIGDMDAASLGVQGSSSTTGIDISTADAATSAITKIDSAISKVSSELSNLGATENRLNHTINNLDTESENITSAESNIKDTDMASEMANYTKLSVITQAAEAMLAQANQQPQQVLTLLK